MLLLEELVLKSFVYNTGFEEVSILKKLKVLNLGDNRVNESFLTSLIALPSLKELDLSGNRLYGSFPAQGTSYHF